MQSDNRSFNAAGNRTVSYPQGRALAPVAPTGRITRRRSSAGPVGPVRPQRPIAMAPQGQRGGLRPTFLTLRHHGKVFVADLPRLSDGQLNHVAKEVREVLESLSRRLEELEGQNFLTQAERDTRIRAATKRDVRAAAGESLARAFLQLARHRLPGATFDSLLQEALAACGPEAAAEAGASGSDDGRVTSINRPPAMPVVLTPEPVAEAV